MEHVQKTLQGKLNRISSKVERIIFSTIETSKKS